MASPSDRIIPSPNSLEAAELLQKLSLDSPKKSLQVTESTKKTSYVPVDGLNKPVERSTSPFVDPSVFYAPNASFQQEFTDPMFYNSNGYQSPAYYYGGNEWDSRYMNSDGVEMTHGVYGDYQQNYGYNTYLPQGSTMGGQDGQMYQYPMSYYQPSTMNNRPYTPNTSQGDVIKTQLPLEGSKGNQTSMHNVMNNRTNLAKYPSSVHQNSSFKSNGLFGSAGLTPANPGFSSTVLQGNNAFSGRNQNQRPFPHLTGPQHPRGTMGPGPSQGTYMNHQIYPNNRSYSQYPSTYRNGGPGFISNSYYPRLSNHRWLTVENKYKSRTRNNGVYSFNNNNNKDNIDGLNELNRGPRAKGINDQENSIDVPISSEREGYNRDDFVVKYEDAKFFVIKSYSEDDVHKSIKYGVWTSTPNGNKKLDEAFKEAQEKKCPLFLLFSVNASGQFVGLAEMVGPVDFEKTVEYWQQDKWSGCFSLKWHLIKDLPNSMLRHITLENNENKPVTNSRDTQEVKLEQGNQILEIFKSHSSKTCILDDFEFYEGRQKVIQDKKIRQRELNMNKQVSESGGKEESSTSEISPEDSSIKN